MNDDPDDSCRFTPMLLGIRCFPLLLYPSRRVTGELFCSQWLEEQTSSITKSEDSVMRERKTKGRSTRWRSLKRKGAEAGVFAHVLKVHKKMRVVVMLTKDAV